MPAVWALYFSRSRPNDNGDDFGRCSAGGINRRGADCCLIRRAAIQFGGRSSCVRRNLWSVRFAVAYFWRSSVFFLRGPAGRIADGLKDFTGKVIFGRDFSPGDRSENRFASRSPFHLGGNLAHEAVIAGELDIYANTPDGAAWRFL